MNDENQFINYESKLGNIIEENEVQFILNAEKTVQRKQIDEYQKKNQELIDKMKQITLKKSKHISDEEILFIQQYLVARQYYLLSHIQSGSEADVYAGFYMDEQQEFAFRVCRIEEEFEIIERELKIVKSIKEPVNVIKYYDEIFLEYSDEQKLGIFVMEKCQCSLLDEIKNHIQNKTYYSQDELLKIVFDLSDGLIELRYHNIIHSDIKPANILKTQEGNYLFSDFGVSQKLKDKQNRTNLIIGYTKNYSAPELHGNNKVIDYSSEIFSLGKTIQYLLKFQMKQRENQDDEIESDDIQVSILKFVEEKLILKDQEQRISCEDNIMSLTKLLYQSKTDVFLKGYLLKVENIIENDKYDESKNIGYYQEVNLSYNLIHLQILKIILIKNQNNKLKEQTIDQQKEVQEKIANSFNNVGQCYYSLNNFEKALEFFQQSLSMFQLIYSENHTDIATTLNNVGQCYIRLQNFEKAQELLEKSLKIYQDLYTGDHPEIAGTLNNIGEYHFTLNNFEIALDYFNKSYQMNQVLYSNNHPEIANSLNNIGSCYKSLNDFEKAIEFLEKGLIMCKDFFSENHPQIASSLNNIGLCYFSLNNFERALEFLQKSLEMYETLFFANNPDVATSLNTLGLCYKGMNKFEKAIEFLEKSLTMYQILESENHPVIVASLNNIGECYYSLSNFEKSLEFLQKSIMISKVLYEENHPDIATTLNTTGLCYQYLNDYEKALELLIQSLNMRQLLDSGNNIATAYSLNNVGECYKLANNIEKALEFLERSLIMHEILYSEDHPQIAAILNNIGECYYTLNNFEKAFQFLEKSLLMRQTLCWRSSRYCNFTTQYWIMLQRYEQN